MRPFRPSRAQPSMNAGGAKSQAAERFRSLVGSVRLTLQHEDKAQKIVSSQGAK